MPETFHGYVGVRPVDALVDSITLNGNTGSIDAGSIGLHDASGARNMFFDPNAEGGRYSALFLGENKAGLLSIRNSAGRDSIGLDGATNQIVMRNTAGSVSLTFNGASGDIILANADCAEDFDISNSTEIEPGTVMVIEQEGKLKECDLPYDKRVAGVISGAGNYKPGLVLDKRKSVVNRKSISLMGKVFCKVDAQSAPIDVGDLLTTSSTKGHAMKALDPVKAFGSVIGKALKPLEEGSRGMIPVLVALQ